MSDTFSRAGFLLLSAALVFPHGIAHAEIFSLEQALATAYETNPRLEAERAALRATDEDVAKALGGWRPSLGLSGSYGTTDHSLGSSLLNIPGGHPRDLTVTLTQPIFSGATIPQTRQAKAAVSAGRAQLDSVEQSVLFASAKAYFDVIADEAIVGFSRENAALLDEQLRMTQERIAVGDVTRTDLSLVLSRATSARADLNFSEAKLAASRAAFLRAIGRPAESLEPSPRLVEAPGAQDQALAIALSGNPDLTAAREQARVADAAVEVAAATFLPSASVQAQYRRSRDQIAAGIDDSSTSIMAQLRIPLYQGGEEYSELRKAKENRNKATLAISDTERQVRQSFDTAWQAQLSARQAIALQEQAVGAAEAAYQGFFEEIKAGERTTYDILNSAQELLSARIALANGRRQLNTSTFDLAVATGRLTAKALNLPVKFYDPQIHYDNDAGRWIGFGD